MEVLVGMTVFAVGVLPLLLVLARAGSAARTRDLFASFALLQGELEIIEAAGVLPEPERTLFLSGREYLIRCDVDTVDGQAQWRLEVHRDGKSITELHGLLALEPHDGASAW